MPNRWQLFKPDLRKIILTLLLPLIVGFILTMSLEGAIAFYGWMLIPMFEVRADTIRYEFNRFVLLWIPFYLVSSIIIALISRSKATFTRS